MNDIYVEDRWREVEMILDGFDKPCLVIQKAKAYAAPGIGVMTLAKILLACP